MASHRRHAAVIASVLLMAVCSATVPWMFATGIGDAVAESRDVATGHPSGSPRIGQTRIGDLEGAVTQLAWDGARNRLLAVVGDRLLSLDLSDSAHPVVQAELAGGHPFGRMMVRGDRLGLVVHHDGDPRSSELQIRDLADPQRAPVIFETEQGLPRLDPKVDGLFQFNGSQLLVPVTGIGDASLGLWSLPPVGPPRELMNWPLAGSIMATALDSSHAVVVTQLPFLSDTTRLVVSVMDLQTGQRRDQQLQFQQRPPLPSCAIGIRLLAKRMWLAKGCAYVDGNSLQLFLADLLDPTGIHLVGVQVESWNVAPPSSEILMVDGGAEEDTLFIGQATDHVWTVPFAAIGAGQIRALQLPVTFIDLAASPSGDLLFAASGEYGLHVYPRPPRGWGSQAFPPWPVPTAIPAATSTIRVPLTPSATRPPMEVRSRNWLPMVLR